MTITSTLTIDPLAGTSLFRYTVNGGPTRTLLYRNGFVEIESVAAPIVQSLDDFTALVTDVSKWIVTTASMLKFPTPLRPSVSGETFSIGARVGTTWNVSSGVTFYGGTAGTMLFTHTPGVGVTLATRPALSIVWANLVLRNQLSTDLIAAALTGVVPPVTASVVGPKGQQGDTGATGATGPQGPPAPYRQRDIGLVWNDVNLNLIGDTPLVIPFARWRPLELTGYSPSIDLSTVARFALYTAPAAGGMAIVNPGLVSLNTTEDDVYSIVPATKRTLQTTATVYLRCTTPKGVPATCSFQLSLRDLTP